MNMDFLKKITPLYQDPQAVHPDEQFDRTMHQMKKDGIGLEHRLGPHHCPSPDAVGGTANPDGSLVISPVFMPNYPYCPVFAETMGDGSIHYQVYLVGGIVDIEKYIPTIAVLQAATEKDTCTSFLDSGGGDLLTGTALASALADTSCNTVNIACSTCASAGSLYWTEGNTQLVTDFADVMYHMSSQSAWGSSIAIRDNATHMIEYVSKHLLSQAQIKGHITEDELQRIVEKDDEIWITAEEMKKRLKSSDVSEVGMEHFLYQMPEVDPTSLYKQQLRSADTRYTSSYDLANMDFQTAWGTVVSQHQFNQNILYGGQASGKFILLRMTDHDYVTVLDWCKDIYTPSFRIAMMRSLDALTEEDTIQIILPGGLPLWNMDMIGGILSAMSRCKGKVITRMAGPAGLVDTAIWVMGQERHMGRYGVGHLEPEFLKYSWLLRSCKSTIATVMKRLVDLEYVTQSELDSYLKDRKPLNITRK